MIVKKWKLYGQLCMSKPIVLSISLHTLVKRVSLTKWVEDPTLALLDFCAV